MTAAQSLNLYNITLRYFKNEADAIAFVKEIEVFVDNKFQDKKEVLATKEDLLKETSNLRKEIAEAKTDIIKWMVGMWIAQIAAIIFLIIKKWHTYPFSSGPKHFSL
jgi:hypothetical protein